jgi:hypothetical protein
MAVVATPILSDLAVCLDLGNSKSVTRRYTDVKVAAPDADVFSVAETIEGLQDLTLIAIQRRITNELNNE